MLVGPVEMTHLGQVIRVDQNLTPEAECMSFRGDFLQEEMDAFVKRKGAHTGANVLDSLMWLSDTLYCIVRSFTESLSVRHLQHAIAVHGFKNGPLLVVHVVSWGHLLKACSICGIFSPHRVHLPVEALILPSFGSITFLKQVQQIAIQIDDDYCICPLWDPGQTGFM